MLFFDPRFLLFVLPAMLLAMGAQVLVHMTYSRARQIGASMSGFAAARKILDSFGLFNVRIEEIPGQLTDHYDSSDKVLRLSSEVYHDRSMASVGIAAHEAGHALQDASRYAPLVVRNMAVPAANIGSGFGITLAALGLVFHFPAMLMAGIVLFSAIVIFQLVNLPVEFDASARAKAQLVQLGIVDLSEMRFVNRVLNAAARTYVAETLQSVLTILYYISRYSSQRESA